MGPFGLQYGGERCFLRTVFLGGTEKGDAVRLDDLIEGFRAPKLRISAIAKP